MEEKASQEKNKEDSMNDRNDRGDRSNRDSRNDTYQKLEDADEIVFRGLVMRSVPERTIREFKKLAREEFDNHYGVTLRELTDHYFEYKLLKQLLLSNNDLDKLVKLFTSTRKEVSEHED